MAAEDRLEDSRECALSGFAFFTLEVARFSFEGSLPDWSRSCSSAWILHSCPMLTSVWLIIHITMNRLQPWEIHCQWQCRCPDFAIAIKTET